MTDTVDLEQIAKLAKQNWKPLILILLLSVTGTLMSASLLEPIYKAETILVPTKNQQGIDALSNLGAIGKIAGIGSSSDELIYLEAITSKYFMMAFIKKYDLTKHLSSDHEKNSDTEKEKAKREWAALDALSKKIKITRDIGSGTVKISLEHSDPAVAKKWLNSYITFANEQLRARATKQASKNLNFLEEQLKSIESSETRKTIYSLIEQQLNKKMLANTNQNYAYEFVAPPFSYTPPIFPKYSIFCVLGIMLGMAINFIYLITLKSRAA